MVAQELDNRDDLGLHLAEKGFRTEVWSWVH